MSSISIESNNENQLTVDEYVRLKKVQERIRNIFEKEDINETLQDAERSIEGLSIDLIIKYAVSKKKTNLSE